MSELLSLPAELAGKIAESLGGSDKKTLRFVCKLMNEVVERLIFSNLVLKYSNYQPELLCEQLEALATRTTNARRHARSLEIRGLSPDSHLGARSRSRSLERSRSRSRGPLSDTHFVNKAILAHLGLAICSLRHLETVWWHVSPTDPEWAQIIIMDLLTNLSRLEELRISFGGGSGSALRLEQLSNLRKISVSGFAIDYRTEVIPGLRTLISNSPSLRHLAIDNHNYRAESDTSTLHDLLGAMTPNSILNLTHLNLRSLCVLLDSNIIPHLRALESLILCNTIDTRTDDLTHLEDAALRDELVDRTKDFCSSSDTIWDTFREEGIFLKDITTDQVNDALLCYLCSYSGVRSLTLWPAPATEVLDATSKLPMKFYNEILPLHAPTLVCLNIVPEYEGKWCFGKHNARSFLQCGKLATLKLSIHSQEIERDKGVDIVQTLLNVADALPYLSHLSILSSDSERSPSIGHIHRVNQEISQSVTMFGPLVSTNQSKIISTPARDYIAKFDEKAGPGLWYRSSMSQGSQLDK